MSINRYSKFYLDGEIKKGNLSSQFVYKYVSFESAVKILENNTLKFSKPKDFNDPFDCKSEIEIYGGINEIAAYLSSFKKQREENSIQQRAYLLSVNPQFKYRVLVVPILEAIEDMNICCFSEIENNILMWTHYSNNHTGICLKFDISKDLECFSLPIKVIYSESFHKFNLLKNFKDGIVNIPRYKSKDWEYEKEVRMVKVIGGELFQPFKKESLVEVIFGLRTSQDNIKEMKNIKVKNKYKNIIYKKMEIVSNKFTLKTKNLL